MTRASNPPSERRPANAVPAITGLRFMPQDIQASLVNISTTGALAASISRVPVGSVVELIFEGGFSPRSVNGRVTRCEVAVMGIDGLLRYHVAVEFDTAISLGDEAEPEPAPASQRPRNRW